MGVKFRARGQAIDVQAQNLGKNLNDITILDFARDNGNVCNGRVLELFFSLLQVAPSQEIKERVVKCMRQIAQSRLDEEQASIEAKVFDAILGCESKVENSKISTQATTQAFNLGVPEKEQVTSRFIGRKVAALGSEKCRLSGGPSGFFWNAKLVDRMKACYYPTLLKLTSLTSLTSQNSLITKDPEQGEPYASEVSEENEVSEVSIEAFASRTKKLEMLKDDSQDKCIVCGFFGRMDWQLTEFNDSWGLLCGLCGEKVEKRLKDNV